VKKKLGFILAVLLLIPSMAIGVELSNVKLGGQVTVRGYSLENMWDYNGSVKGDKWDAFRIKGSVFTGIDLGDNITGFVQFTNQTWGEGVSDFKDNASNKVFLDNAYIEAKNVLGPISLKLGRQNLIYGSGFVILDGQSQFGSTSIYFDGVKASWNITDQILLDALYLKDQENVAGKSDDITLSGFYLTATKAFPVIGGQQEVYALNRKAEVRADGTKSSKDIWMYGIRLSDKLENGLDYSAEGAIQTGTADNGKDQDASGYKLDLGYTFLGLDLKPRIFGQYAFMSGDEADTTDDWEGWDVFYGGWPQFGDLLAWAYVKAPGCSAIADPATSTYGEATYTNLHIATVGLGFAIDDKIFPKFSYAMLRFDEDDNPFYGVTENDFGKYYQLNVKYQYTKVLAFSAYYAIIQPGDAIENFLGTDDDAQEFYWDAEVKF
jgi:hypothetical protein